MVTVALLFVSNIFMTLAWYGHLKFFKGTEYRLWVIVLISWGIAFFEYCFQVPANRLGYGVFSATQLKIIQEVISITVFIVFAITVLGETMRWNHIAAFVLIGIAVYLAVAIK
ncbi:MAG: DMT family protein [Anaerolineales bacterium]|nr:DMT family protein [Anaerolineales bacterium]